MNQNTLEYIKSFSKKAKVTQLGTSLNKKKVEFPLQHLKSLNINLWNPPGSYIRGDGGPQDQD